MPPASGAAATELRAAAVADLPELLRLAREFYDEDGFATSDADLDRNFRALLAAPSAHITLAVRDGAAVGFALSTSQLVLESGLVVELQDLYVRPAHRRQGVAGLLVDDSIRWAKSQDATQVEVVVAPNGRDVSHLFTYYARLGFQDEGRRLVSLEL